MKKGILWVALSFLLVAALVLIGHPAHPAPLEEVVGSEPVVESKSAAFHTLGWWEMPPAYHGNPYAPGGVGVATDYVHGRLFFYNVFTGVYEPYFARSFIEEDTDADGLVDRLTVKLRQDITWEDGVPFTSRDVYAQYYIGGAAWVWSHIWRFLDRIETPNDYTVVFYYYEPSILLTNILLTWEWMRTPAHIYEEWLEQAKDIVRLRQRLWRLEPEVDEALKAELDEKFTVFRDSIKEFRPEKPFSVGPFTVKLVTADEMILAKRPDTPWAETLLFDEIRVMRFTDNPSAWAMFIAGVVDLEKPATPPLVTAEIIARQPKMRHIPVSDFASFCIAINHRRPPLDEPEFRQALAHIIDRDLVRLLSLYYSEPVEYITGVLPSQLERWTTAEARAALNPHLLDHVKAEQLLLGLGMFRGADGFWNTADGEKLELMVAVRPDYTDWVLAADEIARQLTDFGIRATVELVPPPLYAPTLLAGDFDLAISFSVFARFHPVQGFERFFAEGGWIRRITGFDPAGKGPGGEDLDALVRELWVTFDPAKQVEIIDKLAWAVNEHLPVIEFLEKYAQFFVLDGVRVTGWPEHHPCPVLPHTWIPGEEMNNLFGWHWRLAHLKWMLEGTLRPVGSP